MAQDNWSYKANTWDGPHRGQGHRGRRGRRGDSTDPYHWSRDDFDGPSGQGRDRGWGGRGRGGFRGNRRRQMSEQNEHHQGRGGRGGRGGGPPPGLKGREIGMWYAAKSKNKVREKDIMQCQYVHMDMKKERHLTQLLTTIRMGETVGLQPERSYRDPFDDGEAAFEDLTTPPSSPRDTTHTDTSTDEYLPVKTEPSTDDSTPCTADSSDKDGPAVKTEPSDVQSVSVKAEPTEYVRVPIRPRTLDDGYIPLKTEPRYGGGKPLTSQPKGGGHVPLKSEPRDEGFIPPKTEPRDDGYISLKGDNLIDAPGTSGHSTAEVKMEPDSEILDLTISDSDDDREGVTDAIRVLPEVEVISDEDDDDDTTTTSVSELYRYAIQLIDDGDNPFMAEFLLHRHTRNRSYESLSDMAAYSCLERDARLDSRLLAEAADRWEHNDKFHRMLQFRKRLPSYQMREEIIGYINSNQVIVISGETGCGKTTQVAQFILEDYVDRGDGSLCRIVCTQPRRISAIAVAERVAEERGELCGESVGYQIRLESQQPRQQGSILYCTTGIMLKWLQSDPWLSRTSHVILDEIHERDLQSDFLMIILKELTAGRPDLKLILMSATLNAQMFSQYFRNCPMLNIPGYTFPVEEYMMEDVVEMTGYALLPDRRYPRAKHGRKHREAMEKRREYECWIDGLNGRYSPHTQDVLRTVMDDKVDIDLAAAVVGYIIRAMPEGAILVFMPGAADIKQLNDALNRDYHQGRVLIIPLHSRMPTINQREVFSRPPPGVRKIVIATNIAETSITIDDVVYVVDCGKIKMKNFDPANNIATLKPEWVSRANAKQRRGRAGRVQPGICYHLYTAFHFRQFADYQLPEMLRTRLEELCLQIKMLKLGRIETFVGKAMQPPSMEALHHAISTLVHLNALDEQEELTPLGYHLAKMPCDPHTSKMLLFGAMFSCLSPILTVGASLSFKDAFYIPMGKERLADQKRQEMAGDTRSDHLMLIGAYEGWERAKERGTASKYCWDHFLSASTLKMLQDMRRQFAQFLSEMGFLKSDNPHAADANRNSGNKQLIKAIICAGLYPNVANIVKVKKHVRGDSSLSTKTEKRVLLHPQSVNWGMTQFNSRWLVYHLKMMTSKIFLYDTTMVSPYPLLFFGGNIHVTQDGGVDCVIIDGWIKFRANKRIARLVKELRIELDRLLAYKVTHPGASCWKPEDKEGVLLQAIIDLITTEDDCMVSSGVRLLR